MQNLFGKLHLLNSLLVAGERWCCTSEKENTFHESKKLLASARVLASFDPSRPTVLITDPSHMGLGHCWHNEKQPGRSVRLRSHVEVWHLRKETTASWTRKRLASCLKSQSSSNTRGADLSRSSLIANCYWVFSQRIRLFLSTALQGCCSRPCCCLGTAAH